MLTLSEYLAEHTQGRARLLTRLWQQQGVPVNLRSRLTEHIEADWAARATPRAASCEDVMRYAYQLASFTLDRLDRHRDARRARLRAQRALAQRCRLTPAATARLLQEAARTVPPAYAP